jgi:hypothetical protein
MIDFTSVFGSLDKILNPGQKTRLGNGLPDQVGLIITLSKGLGSRRAYRLSLGKLRHQDIKPIFSNYLLTIRLGRPLIRNRNHPFIKNKNNWLQENVKYIPILKK